MGAMRGFALLWPCSQLPGNICPTTLALGAAEESLLLHLLLSLSLWGSQGYFSPFSLHHQAVLPSLNAVPRHGYCGCELQCALGPGPPWPLTPTPCVLRLRLLHLMSPQPGLNFFSISRKFKTHPKKNQVIENVQVKVLIVPLLLFIALQTSTEAHPCQSVPWTRASFHNSTKPEVQTVLLPGGSQARLSSALWRSRDRAPSLAVPAAQSTQGHKHRKDSRAAVTRTGSSELKTPLTQGLAPHSLFPSAGRDLKS